MKHSEHTLYRPPKRDVTRSVHAEAQAGKDGRLAILFASIAIFLNAVQQKDTRISISGVNIEVTEPFILTGIFCGLAISFGFFSLSWLLEAIVYGPVTYSQTLYRKIIAGIYNRPKKYHPKTIKIVSKIAAVLIAIPFGLGYIVLGLIWVFGVLVSIDDFANLILKLLPFA